MALVTRLGFSLYSTWHGRGTKQAASALTKLSIVAGLATVAIATLSATSVLAGAAIGLALAGLPLLFGAIGIAAAVANDEVKTSFVAMAKHVWQGLKEASAPMVPVLVKFAQDAAKTFDVIRPSL